jgi:hypothetical protein
MRLYCSGLYSSLAANCIATGLFVVPAYLLAYWMQMQLLSVAFAG